MKLNVEKALEWLSKGAQPSKTVRDIFRKFGVMEKFHELKFRKKEEKDEGSS